MYRSPGIQVNRYYIAAVGSKTYNHSLAGNNRVSEFYAISGLKIGSIFRWQKNKTFYYQ